MKPVRLVLLPAMASEPAPFLVIGQGGFVLERGALSLEGERPEPMRTIAIVPGADVVVRWLDLPAGGATQQKAAALWMLREALAASPERLTVALGPAVPAGQPRMVAVVSATLLDAWSDYLGGLGVYADVLLPDMLALEPPVQDDALSAIAFGSAVALRGQRFAATVQSDLVDLVAAGHTIIPVDDPVQVERVLVGSALSPALNLRPERREAGSARGWRRAAVLAAALVISPLVLILAQAARDDLAARRIGQETTAAIARVSPELAGAPDPVAALRQQVRVAPLPGGVAATAAALFAAVEGVEGAELDILVSDPGEGMKATLSHPDYKDVEVMQTALAPSGLTVEETGVSEEGGRIVSDITIGGAR
jgi:general secretion pathway protein L